MTHHTQGTIRLLCCRASNISAGVGTAGHPLQLLAQIDPVIADTRAAYNDSI